MTAAKVGPFPNPSKDAPYPSAMARRFLGMDRVLAYGPRPKCDYRDVCDRWWRGETTQETAAALGVSRATVQQVIRGAVQPWEKRLHRRVQHARHWMRALPGTTSACRTCSAYFTRGSCGPVGDSCGRSAFCSAAHYRVWLALRFHTSEHAHQVHRVAVARIHHRADPTPASLARLQRAESGTPAPRPRWFNSGSKNFAAAIEAFENGWPIFDELPEQCQAQVREAGPG